MHQKCAVSSDHASFNGVTFGTTPLRRASRLETRIGYLVMLTGVVASNGRGAFGAILPGNNALYPSFF